MLKPIEYVGRINRTIKQLKTWFNYVKTSPHDYPINYVLKLVERYDRNSEGCKNCKDYFVCDVLVNRWSTGKFKIKPNISKN